MNMRTVLSTICVALFLVATGCSGARVTPDVPSPTGEVVVQQTRSATIHTLVSGADGVMTSTHVIEGPTALVIVDTHLLRADARALRAYADAIGKPIERVIVTHGHPDHYFGIESFTDVPVYATENTHRHMQQRHRAHHRGHVERVGDAVTDEVHFPTATLPEGEFVIDGVRYEISEMPNLEDIWQTVIRLPDEGVLIVQDLAGRGTHLFLGGKRFERWAGRLRSLADDESVEHVLIGHGLPGDRSVLTECADYLDEAAVIYEQSEDADAWLAAMQTRWPDYDGLLVLQVAVQFLFD
jgi:glyoxylase-like metal-dependent hydrolase (beta-lactamase superfamily II)